MNHIKFLVFLNAKFTVFHLHPYMYLDILCTLNKQYKNHYIYIGYYEILCIVFIKFKRFGVVPNSNMFSLPIK